SAAGAMAGTPSATSSPTTSAGQSSSISRRCNGASRVDPERAQEISERDQLWASLRALRPDIDRLALGGWDATDRQKQIVTLISRIVAAEMDFRDRDTAAE